MIARRFLTIAMAAFLSYDSVLAQPAAVGMVVLANGVHINTTNVTAGATVFDGDRFVTETQGALRLRSYGGTVQLAGGSEVTMRSWPNGAHGTQAQLAKGTLEFGSSGLAVLEIVADEARIRPELETMTVGLVRVIGPRELAVYAKRGPLQFSYRGQTATIAEGKSYKVILEQPDGDPQKERPAPPTKPPKLFKFVVGGEIAAIGILTYHELHESPDRP